MKKALALLLALCLMAALFAGCGGETTPSTAPSTSPSTAPEGAPEGDEPSTEPSAEPVERKEVKIGYVVLNLEDTLNVRRMASWDYFAQQYDHVEVTFTTGGAEAESNISAVENLLLQGCNAIALTTTQGIETIRDMCDDAGAYLLLVGAEIQTEEQWTYMCESDYWLGYFGDDLGGEAEVMSQWIVENGYREIIIMATPEGLTPGETKAMYAYEDYFDNWNAENPDDQVTYYVYEALHPAQAETAAAAMAAHPTADMIIGITSGLKFVYPQIATANKLGQIGLATFSIYENAKDAFEDGTLKYVVPRPDDSAFAFYILYDAVQGVPLSDGPVDFLVPDVRITSIEELEDYNSKYGDNSYQVITYEWAQQFDKVSNPDVTIDDMITAMDEMTLEKIMAGEYGG